jgi:hypothetical protein
VALVHHKLEFLLSYPMEVDIMNTWFSSNQGMESCGDCLIYDTGDGYA